MKEDKKHFVRKVNQFLNRPLVALLAFMLLFGFYAYGNAQNQKDNRILLENTKVIIERLEKQNKALRAGVEELKADNARQTRFIGCLLAIHGEGTLVSDGVREQCEKMSNGVEIDDVRGSGQSSSEPKTKAKPKTTDKSNPAPEPEETPLFFPPNQGLIRDSVPILGNL